MAEVFIVRLRVVWSFDIAWAEIVYLPQRLSTGHYRWLNQREFRFDANAEIP